MTDTSVAIVGGGPVGLALACDLGWRGVPCLLIEQGDGTVGTPKMNEVNIRSMELCRRWGITDEVDACPFPADYPLDSAFVTSLFGYELGRVERPARADERPEYYGPMRMQVCSQIWFDPILQRFARTFPTVSLRYHTRLERFEETGDGVVAHVTDVQSGAPSSIRARYLVGCDGAMSTTRRQLGIVLEGSGIIGNPINLFFLAPDLLKDSGQRRATFYLCLDEGGLWANMRIINPATGLWRLMIDNTDGSVTEESVDREGYLVRALGRAYPVEWVDTSIWRRRSALAASYGRGRVLLAGDSVHQLSPTGAMGMNTGIADAVDLAWKLDAVLAGWGGERLIAAYDAERRPVGARAVGMATKLYKNNEAFRVDGDLTEPGLAGDRRRKAIGERLVAQIGGEFRTIGLQIGYRYEGSPIIVPDGTPEGPDDPEVYEPTARPGSRAPHVWLSDGRSILDMFGRGFVLLRLGTAAPDTSSFERAARARYVPLDVVALREPAALDLYRRCLVLVRPDGHVAWRADDVPADVERIIDCVRGGCG
ncbi:MAG: FAD-dependent monooxygenase [Hyphomicrobiales bacterium]|nr:FAD-dependent monooxygenase [Hyphomicrobiales bacterium]